MIWVLKGPGPEMIERMAAVGAAEHGQPNGRNTYEEGCDIADWHRRTHGVDADVIYVLTSNYHVPRAYLTIRKAIQDCQRGGVLHVWGTGTVTNEQAQREAKKLAEAQARGHALRWEDLT